MSARAWWPGRTDEVRRVADRIARMSDEEYARMTVGDLAGRTSSDVFIVSDAIDLLNETGECMEAFAGGGS